jgi:hypothetical protein
MKIDFNKLLAEHNQKSGEATGPSTPSTPLTKSQLARDMVQAGVIKSERGALNLIHYHINGKAKSADFLMLEFLKEKFNQPIEAILTN